VSVSDRGPDDRGESASCLEDSLPSRLFYVRSPHEVQTMSKNQQGCPLIPSSQRESVVAVAFVVCCCRCCCFPKPSPKIGCPIHRGLIAMSGTGPPPASTRTNSTFPTNKMSFRPEHSAVEEPAVALRFTPIASRQRFLNHLYAHVEHASTIRSDIRFGD
jgi:hypothetical protein